jgi:hypothetical protein
MGQALREQYVQFNPTQSPYTIKLQLLLTSLRALSNSSEGNSSAYKRFSKNFYMWGQETPGDDFVDISDRLAFLIYQTGQLELDYSKKSDGLRTCLKDIRTFEEELIPRRKKRESVRQQIQKIEGFQPEKGSSAAKRYSGQVAALKAQLAELEIRDEVYESSAASLKRQKLVDGFK